MASGSSKDRRASKANKVSTGHINMIKDTGGNYIRVPYYKPARLTQGQGQKGKEPVSKPSNPSTNNTQELQHQVKATYSRIAGANLDKYEVRVIRTDKAPMSREDQWKIQFGVSDYMVQAANSGKTGEHLAHGGTKLNHRELIIYCRQAAGSFYKEAITKITGYEAYLPGERPPGTEIYTTLPGMATPLLSKLNEHFVAGTFGSLTIDQVRISRKAWRMEGDKETSWHVYLEINEEALQWLKAKNWMSPIGLYVPLWGHPKVIGIEGFIAPDENIKALRATLRQEVAASAATGEQDQTITQANPNQEANSPPQDTPQATPDLSSIPLPVGQESVRSRHITGGNETAKDNKDEDDILLSPELERYEVILTEKMEEELLQTQDENTSTPHRSRKTSTGSKRSDRGSSSSPGSEGKIRKTSEASEGLESVD